MQNIIHISDIDNLSGRSFELFTGDLLKQLGYSNITVTKASNDKGLDVIAEDSQGEKIGVQCKHLAPHKSVGYRAVEEAYTGKAIYHVNTGIILTNQRLTNGASKSAKKLHIRYWNRNVLKLLIDIANNSIANINRPINNNSVSLFANKYFLKQMPYKIPSAITYKLYVYWCRYHNLNYASTRSFRRRFYHIIHRYYIYSVERIVPNDAHNLKDLTRKFQKAYVNHKHDPFHIMIPKCPSRRKCYKRAC